MTASEDYHFDQNSQGTIELAAALGALERAVTVSPWTPHLSVPSPAFVALPGSLMRMSARIERHYRKLAKIGERIAKGCPRARDQRDLDAINRKIDLLGEHLSAWDPVIEEQARTWHAEKLRGSLGTRRRAPQAPVSRRTRRRCGRTRARSSRRRRCTASRARSSGDDGGDGDEPAQDRARGIGVAR